MPQIHRLLIANRGEIAVRVARTARDMGIAALGVYSDADVDALHVEAMDDAVRIGPGPASESYLSVERILVAAKTLQADAIHPGYGFLSERAPFAQAVQDAGLIFVGPPPEAIAAMGDKSEAKRRARAHDVPVVPGYDGEDQSDDALRAHAREIGTPLLVKASAGGGGRGMRVVNDLKEFDEALAGARREAQAAFGDDRMLLEKYVARPRHIEFQILADAHGTTLSFGERECSIQRRHQKILEEAPSVALDAGLRARMAEAAIAAARSVGYVNAGTVEFLLDESGAFYFLEMNARLQVEHPVTELVYGVDLVRLQLEVAAGKPLELRQSGLAPRGWAIEGRINAEDPGNGYLPAIGRITNFEPPTGPGLRLDSGVRAGSEVGIFYDSMIAKLIAYGSDRAAAIRRLERGLADFRIEGIGTNVPLLLAIARDVTFRAGNTTTAYLTEHENFLHPDVTGEPDETFAFGIVALVRDGRAWRVGGVGIPIALRAGDRTVRVVATLEAGEGEYRFEGDLTGSVRAETRADRIVLHSPDGTRHAATAVTDARGVTVYRDGMAVRLTFAPPPSLDATGAGKAGGLPGTVTAPMPGKIAKVSVKTGDAVGERDLLVVLEAMKMEHRIEAPRAGTVTNVAVASGEFVTGGATLVQID